MNTSERKAKSRRLPTKHIAIVGLGSIGRRHLRLIRRLRPSIKITAVRSSMHGLRSGHPMVDESVGSLEEAIDSGVQAAIIASPASLHLRHALSCFHARVHVLVEKPVSVSYEGVREVLAIEKAANVTCLVGYCFRHDLSANYFAELLKKECLGELLDVEIVCCSFLPDWRSNVDYRKSVSARKELGGGALLELSHEIDYANWLFGPLEVKRVNLENTDILGLDVEESVDLLFKNKNEVEISIHLDFSSRQEKRFCLARFAKGYIKWNLLDYSIEFSGMNSDRSREVFELERDDMYLRQLKHFLDCVEKGHPPMVPLSEGVETLRLIEAARTLSREQQ